MNNHLSILPKQVKFDLKSSRMHWRLGPLIVRGTPITNSWLHHCRYHLFYNPTQPCQLTVMTSRFCWSFIHSFIHSLTNLYSTSSRKLLRGAPDSSTVIVVLFVFQARLQTREMTQRKVKIISI